MLWCLTTKRYNTFIFLNLMLAIPVATICFVLGAHPNLIQPNIGVFLDNALLDAKQNVMNTNYYNTNVVGRSLFVRWVVDIILDLSYLLIDIYRVTGVVAAMVGFSIGTMMYPILGDRLFYLLAETIIYLYLGVLILFVIMQVIYLAKPKLYEKITSTILKKNGRPASII